MEKDKREWRVLIWLGFYGMENYIFLERLRFENSLMIFLINSCSVHVASDNLGKQEISLEPINPSETNMLDHY